LGEYPVGNIKIGFYALPDKDEKVDNKPVIPAWLNEFDCILKIIFSKEKSCNPRYCQSTDNEPGSADQVSSSQKIKDTMNSAIRLIIKN
jgi:hypothetical protein